MEAQFCGRGKGNDWINMQQNLKNDSLYASRRCSQRAGSGLVLFSRAGDCTSLGSSDGPVCESSTATKEVGAAVKQAGAATTSVGLFIKNRPNNPAAAAISVGGELMTCVTANWDLPSDVILTCGCPRSGKKMFKSLLLSHFTHKTNC